METMAFELNEIFGSILIWEILADVWHTWRIEIERERGSRRECSEQRKKF